jgi:hypothetical protein
MARTFHRLTSARVKSVKSGIHPDGQGLYLQCTEGSDGHLNKNWFYRFARGGKERRMGLGAIRDVSLAQARELAEKARRQHRSGTDPIAARDAERQKPAPEAVVTFRNAFETFFATKHQTLAKAKHRHAVDG